MAGRSHVRKRRRGCLSGCLTKIILLLGLAAVVFVGACVLGLVKNDPVTGAPFLSFQGIQGLENLDLPQIDLSQIDLSQIGLSGIDLQQSLKDVDLAALGGLAQGLQIPGISYGMQGNGLAVKTLRAGEGEAVLVCADGYTMLLGGGSGMGEGICAQLLRSGVKY